MRQNLLKDVPIFWAILVSFREHSLLTEQQGKAQAISLTPLYHSTHLTELETLAEQLLQRAHLYSQLAARLKSGTFGLRAQVSIY